jgi:hypothetical protein
MHTCKWASFIHRLQAGGEWSQAAVNMTDFVERRPRATVLDGLLAPTIMTS